jgi:hypothetical protein
MIEDIIIASSDPTKMCVGTRCLVVGCTPVAGG